MVPKFVLVMVLTTAPVIALAPASAHHSFAMFDNSKNVTLEGTIKDYQWTNPHSWIQLVTKNAATGKDEELSIEGGSPNMLSRQGWSRSSMKVGDRAIVVIHPLKSGAAGGSLVSAVINGVRIGAQP